MKFQTVLFLLVSMLPMLPGGLVLPADAVPPAPWEADDLMGKPAPDFSLPDTEGNTFRFKDLRGKVVLLNFFASWCPPCKAEIPSMNELNTKLKEKGLRVVAVSSDRKMKTLKRFLEKSPVNFAVLHDPENEIAPRYKVFALPTSYVIDRDGVLVKKIFGGYDWMSGESIEMFEQLLGN